MRIRLNSKEVVLCVALFITSFALSQDNSLIYKQFEGFKKVGFYASLDYYQSAKFDKFERSYTLIANNSVSFTVGFDYVAKPVNEFSFRTGLFLRRVPWFNFQITIPQEANPANFPNDFETTFKSGSHFVFSVPFFYELKKQMGQKVFFSAIGGVDVSIMTSGSIGTGVSVGDEKGNTFDVFRAYADTNNFPFYPNLVLRPGLYFTGKKVIIQASFIYQKSIIPFFKGEYQFGNLVDAPPVRGDITLTGDYIGLAMTVFVKKSKRRRKE